MKDKLIGKYSPDVEAALTDLFKSTPFDYLVIENVYSMTKTINGTREVLKSALQLGLDPYSIIALVDQSEMITRIGQQMIDNNKKHGCKG